MYGYFIDMAEVEVFCSNRDFGYVVPKSRLRQAWVSCLIVVIDTSDMTVSVEFTDAKQLRQKLGVTAYGARLSLVGMAEINERLRKKDVPTVDNTLAREPTEDNRGA